MRVVFAGGTICDYHTLQRLVLVADEIAFLDRPSVTFGDWGMIGTDSEFRRMNIVDAPITFSVHAPPSGQANELYRRYIQADLGNPNFVQSFLEGLARDNTFRTRFIQLKANYGSSSGQEILESLLKDPSLASANVSEPINGRLMFKTDTQEGRRETLKILLVEASVHVTNALVVSESTGLMPVSDDPFLCRLLALRTGDSKYVGSSPRVSPYLGLAIAKSVIPDEALSKLEIKDLFEYRRSAKDAYASWSVEIDRLASIISELNPETVDTDIAKIINAEVRPKLLQYRNELRTARDKLFGDLVKKVAAWEMATLSIAYLAGLNVASAFAAFAGALAPAVPAVVDYFNSRREIQRRNSMAYLIGITKAQDEER